MTTTDPTIDDIRAAQAASRAYLNALEADDEAILDDPAFDMPVSVRLVLQQVGALLVGLGYGAPTEGDVCTALLRLKAHIYAASGKRHRLLLTPSAELFAGHLFSAIYDTKAEAKQAARSVGAVAWNY